jgi:hypothetical protein
MNGIKCAAHDPNAECLIQRSTFSIKVTTRSAKSTPSPTNPKTNGEIVDSPASADAVRAPNTIHPFGCLRTMVAALLPDVPVAGDDESRRGQLGEAHRSTGVHFLCADTDFRTESEFPTVSESR